VIVFCDHGRIVEMTTRLDGNSEVRETDQTCYERLIWNYSSHYNVVFSEGFGFGFGFGFCLDSC
jgi:hypothetical protein